MPPGGGHALALALSQRAGAAAPLENCPLRSRASFAAKVVAINGDFLRYFTHRRAVTDTVIRAAVTENGLAMRYLGPWAKDRITARAALADAILSLSEATIAVAAVAAVEAAAEAPAPGTRRAPAAVSCRTAGFNKLIRGACDLAWIPTLVTRNTRASGGV